MALWRHVARAYALPCSSAHVCGLCGLKSQLREEKRDAKTESCSSSGGGRGGLLGLERSGDATYSCSGATLLANRKGSVWRTWSALPVGPYLDMRSGRMLVSSVRSVLALLGDQISPSDNDEAAD